MRIVFLLSEADPVARGVGERWGALPASDLRVDGAPLRELAPGRFVLRRPGQHIHDAGLEGALVAGLRGLRPTVIFPSIHWSETGPLCFTVHPLGNPTPQADAGGIAERLVPTDPPLMTAVLRAEHALGQRFGVTATFEATHHGPWLSFPSFFAEIGGGAASGRPEPDQVAGLADLLREILPESGEHVAVGVGGGHYAPHFTQLALERRWAFGHLLSRHVYSEMRPELAAEAARLTPGCEGTVYARAADALLAQAHELGTRLRDSGAPRRE
ncbi:MAG: D-aminoacyl-tRNA deacylase [Thermoplasmata archaeon]|nr:D-aminoacyl-tRNA deacylase [Thermoplasmata archaeon]